MIESGRGTVRSSASRRCPWPTPRTWPLRSSSRRAARARRIRPVDACKYLGALIASAANGVSRTELLSETFWRWARLHPEIEERLWVVQAQGPPAIVGSGYVVRSLEAALWALDRSDSFRDGLLLAANLGDDADTTAAVYGQLAGAIYGDHGIPHGWRAKLAHHDQIRDFAARVHEREATSQAVGAEKRYRQRPTFQRPDGERPPRLVSRVLVRRTSR